MIKHINPRQLQNGLKPKITAKTFPGATIADMTHYVKLTLSTAPDEIILHIGTNDLKAKTPEAVVNAAVYLRETTYIRAYVHTCIRAHAHIHTYIHTYIQLYLNTENHQYSYLQKY